MGSMVYYLNSEYGFDAVSIAASKQAIYTFFASGFMVKLCENTAIHFQNPKFSKVMSAIVPGVLTSGLTYLVHSLKGTPEPFDSTIPTLFTPITYGILGTIKRNKLERILNEKE